MLINFRLIRLFTNDGYIFGVLLTHLESGDLTSMGNMPLRFDNFSDEKNNVPGSSPASDWLLVDG